MSHQDKGIAMIEQALTAAGFVVGARIRFGYFKGSEVKQYEGQIVNIRMANAVKTKSDVQSVSLFLVIVKTAEGVKSFWEANMTGTEIL